MIGTAWRVLRRQGGTLLGAVVMASVGAALITAFLVVQNSEADTRTPVARYAGVQVVAAGEGGEFTPVMVRDLETVPGVAEAIPELTFPAEVLAAGTPVLEQERTAQFGHAWTSARLTPFTIVSGTEPRAPGQVVLDAVLAREAGVDVGDKVSVQIGGIIRELRICGIAAAGDGAQQHQRALFFTPAEAAQVADRGLGRVDAVGLLLDPGADPSAVATAVEQRVRQALAGDVPRPSGRQSVQVAWGLERGELEGTMGDHRASAQAMVTMVWIVAFMAVAVIGGALVTSVRRRASLFALLRAVGATPRQVRALCQSEALLISVLAFVAGGTLGMGLAWLLIEVFRALGVASPLLRVHYRAAPLLISGATVLVIGQVAAWFAGRAALRFRPGDVLAGRVLAVAPLRRTWPRAAVGALVLGGAGLLQAAGMAGALPVSLSGTYGVFASALVIIGIGLVGSTCIHLFARMSRRPVVAAAPIGGYLAAANVRHHRRRYAGVAAPLAVGVAIAGWALSGLPLFALSNGEQVAERFDSSHVISTPLVRDAPLGLSAQARAAVADVPGVRNTVGWRDTWMAASLASAREVPPTSLTWGTVISGQAAQLIDLGATEGDLRKVDAGEGVALGSNYAARQGITLGDRVQVRLSGATAPSTVPVVALFAADRGGQEGAVVSQAALGDNASRRWFTYLLADAGGDPTDLSAPSDASVMISLVKALSPSGVAVEDHARFLESYVSGRIRALDNFGTISTVLVGLFLIIAAVTALALSSADRGRELGALRLLNATPRQLRSMVAWETALTVLPAWLLGVVATLWMAFAMAGGDLAATLWAYPTAALLAMGLVSLLLAVVGSLIAAGGVQRSTDVRGRAERHDRPEP